MGRFFVFLAFSFSAFGAAKKNLAPNPSFEENPYTHYRTHGTARFAVDSSIKVSGLQSISIDSQVSSLTRWMSQDGLLRAVPQHEYTFSGFIRAESAAGAYLAISFWDQSGTYVSNSTRESGVVAGTVSSFNFRSVTAIAPANAAFLRIEMRMAGTGKAWFDYISLADNSEETDPTPTPSPTPAPTPVPTPPPVLGSTYYLSPTGNDSSSGSNSAPWRSFAKAYSVMQPGDALILKDGEYFDSLSPIRSGTASKRITTRAEHDGKAIVNGSRLRIPLRILGLSYHVIEGIVFHNSSGHVIYVSGTQNGARATNNIFRRISAYNANPVDASGKPANHHIYNIDYSDYNLFEDCVGAGVGRTVATNFGSNGNIWRRCWFRGDQGTGANTAAMTTFQLYHSKNSIYENNIAADPILPAAFYAPDELVADWTNSYNEIENDFNRYLGSISTNLKYAGFSVANWDTKRSKNHLYKDNVVLYDGRYLSQYATRNGINVRGGTNLTYDHLTLIGDSAVAGYSIGFWMSFSSSTGGSYIDVFSATLKNSIISGFSDPIVTSTRANTVPHLTTQSNVTSAQFNTSMFGRGAYLMGASNAGLGNDGKPVGAKLMYRYVNGQLTQQPLWPFPMEERIWRETAIYTRLQQSATYHGALVNGQLRKGGYFKTLDGAY